MENLIVQGRFSDGIDTIYKQVEEEKLWQLYLSNPMKDKSYVEWKNEVIYKHQEQNNFEVAKNIDDIKNNARNILKNFKP